jgi:hypothetical protein
MTECIHLHYSEAGASPFVVHWIAEGKPVIVLNVSRYEWIMLQAFYNSPGFRRHASCTFN